MDIPRPSRKKEKMRRRILFGILAVVALVLITVGLSSLEPAAREVDRSAVWTGKVERGEFLRAVRGPGTLVPKEIRFIAANQNGVVEKRYVEAGSEVTPETVILELENPELTQSVEEARLQLAAARAELVDLEVRLDSQILDQEARVAQAKADFESAKLEAEANQELFDADVVSSIVWRKSLLQVENQTVRYEKEKQRLEKITASAAAQLQVKQAEVDQRQAVYQLRREQLESLKVRAGIHGVLQEVLVEVGQRVSPGETLARVADPKSLKAELRIPETQAKDVALNQVARIDTRNGIVKGHVVRIDPSVQQGTVTVDVEIDEPLPPGARPDLSVDGTIEIERLVDVLYMPRPSFAQPNATIGLYKLSPDGTMAHRVKVRIGRMSVQEVEVIEGLEEGDEVILSDTNAFDDADRIRLR
ncbi:MAG: HlyD family efflux transporter periplasmic adaptor subunit [Acidobacteria bacterium]|nr:MAG: HlyD family efflux transporter periplasmic adaptor subunit [Acidobacteriota bacterium]